MSFALRKSVHRRPAQQDILTMHSARTTSPGEQDPDDQDPDDQEPAVLSYTQFRNHLGLLEWRRRLAEYEQRGAAIPAVPQQRPGAAAPLR
jgi:hypothetical protein